MLNQAFVGQWGWRRAALTFVLGVVFGFAGNSVFEWSVYAQFREASPGIRADQTPEQHRAPIVIRRTPNAPVGQASGKLAPSIRNQIVERHSEQLKSQDLSRRLEQRRRALRQQRRPGGRNLR